MLYNRCQKAALRVLFGEIIKQNTLAFDLQTDYGFQVSTNRRVNHVNLLNPKIQIYILISCSYTFAIEVVGGNCYRVSSSKIVLCDPVLNSRDHSVL